jgi:hypothetical protein
MKVICINISGGGEVDYLDSRSLTPVFSKHSLRLTLGKTYDVINDSSGYNPGGYWIKDDNNDIVWFTKNIFITQEQWREEQLNKILF